MRQITLLGLFFSVLPLTSCGKGTAIAPINDAQTACKDYQAVIGVYDGFYQNLCGCTESTGQRVYPEDSLDCTVAKGTTMFFIYFSPSVSSQIVSIGTPSFISSVPYNPTKPVETRSYARIFSSVGTYHFTNAFNASMSGQIIVY